MEIHMSRTLHQINTGYTRFGWSMRAISSYLATIYDNWAVRIGVTSPQLTMLLALRDFDPTNSGLPVREVAKRLHVDSSFVTTQSKVLERSGLIRRVASNYDARVVLLSLTPKAASELAKISAKQNQIYEYVFSDLGEQGKETLTVKISALEQKFEKASVLASIDF